MSEILSARDAYSSEIRQIPIMERDAQAVYAKAARMGDEEAAHALLLNCLNFTFATAMRLYRAYEPRYVDPDDLISHANLVMMEALPRALNKRDPVAYLMSAGVNEQRRLCTRGDTLIKKPSRNKYLDMMPETVPLDEARDRAATPLVESDPSLLIGAVQRLPKRKREIISEYLGLDGPAKTIPELAREHEVSYPAMFNRIARAKLDLAMRLAPYVSSKVLETGG